MMEYIHKRLMKTRTVRNAVILGCLLMVSVAARAQEVNFPKQKATLQEAFSEIAWQTPYTLFFNHAKVDLDKQVTLPGTGVRLPQLLDRLAEETGYLFQTEGTHILVITPTPYTPAASVRVRSAFPDNAYRPSYNAQGGNNEAFVVEMNYLAERSRNLLKQQHPELDPSQTVVRDTLWSFTPPVRDRLYTYPDQNVSLPRTGVVSGAPAAYSPKLPSGALKINLLYGGLAQAPNLAYEFGLGRRTSLDLSAGYNPWNRKTDREDNRKLIHIIAKAEFRYWLCERFNGHFFGIHPFYWRYNVSSHKVPLLFKKEYQYDGHAFGFGVSYGYTWMFAKRWGVEVNAGVGVAFMNHKRKECALCGPAFGRESKTYFGPTSLGVKLIWTIN